MTKKMNMALQMALMVAVAGGGMARAQQTAIQPEVVYPGAEVYARRVAQTTGNHGNGSRIQEKDHLFDGTGKFAAGASEVAEINLDPSTMSILETYTGREAAMASKLKMITVHTYKYDKPGMYKQEDVDAFRTRIENNWTCSIRVRDKNESTDICSRLSNETNDLVIMTAEPLELTFIHVSGDLSLNELQQMSGTADGLRRRAVSKASAAPGAWTPQPAPKALTMPPPGRTSAAPAKPPAATEPPSTTPAPAAPAETH